MEGHCVTLGGATPYRPIIDALKRAFGIREGEDEARMVQRVEEQAAAWGPETRATVPYLRYLLSVDPGDPSVTSMDPLARRAGTLDALRSLLLEGSRRRPLVLAIEDLHWMDEPSGEALAALVDAVPRLPVLLVLTHRPGYAHPLGDRPSTTRLALQELPPEESAALAGAVLEVTALPAPLARFVTGKAEGNPFFLEEVTRSLREMGALRRTEDTYILARPAEDIRLPDTIQEVILSRLDRLGDEAKATVQLAAVIGREFTVRLVQRLSDLPTRLEDALGELKAHELIYEQSYSPEVAYAFTHALTHEVALSTLLSARRKALHRLAAARSRRCTPTGSRSSTSCWPTTTPKPSPGRRHSTTCSRPATRQRPPTQIRTPSASTRGRSRSASGWARPARRRPPRPPGGGASCPTSSAITPPQSPTSAGRPPSPDGSGTGAWRAPRSPCGATSSTGTTSSRRPTAPWTRR